MRELQSYIEGRLGSKPVRELIKEAVARAVKARGWNPPKQLLRAAAYHLLKDMEGLGKLTPLLWDPEIEDIKLPSRGDRRLWVMLSGLTGWLPTNVELTEDEARELVLKMAELCGKQVSLASPRLEGKLPSGERVQAALGYEISEGGTAFVIRKYVRRKLTLWDWVRQHAITPEAAAYLWLLVEEGISGLIAGETGSGKTTFLSSLLRLIPWDKSIITVEDTPEIALEHRNWIQLVTRPGSGSTREIGFTELMRDVLRMRPDYCIIGESRGEETRILAQFIAMGRTGFATFHAISVQDALRRLLSHPLSLTPEQAAMFRVIVLLRIHEGRRLVAEIAETEAENMLVKARSLFKLRGGRLEGRVEDSRVLARVAERRGCSMREVLRDWEEKVRRLRS